MQRIFYIDGTARERIGQYAQWRVVDIDGNIVCALYGPASFSAAVAVCKQFNAEGIQIGDLEYYERYSYSKLTGRR